MYKGTLKEFENYKLRYGKILEKWKDRSGSIYRYEIKIEGNIMYIFLIRTITGVILKDFKDEVETLKDEIEALTDEVEILKNAP